MSRATVLAGTFSALSLLVGCDGSSRYGEVIQDTLKEQEAITEILKKVKDPESMKAAMAPMKRAHARVEQIKKRAEALPKPPPQGIAERLNEKYGERIKEVVPALAREVERVEQLPGGKEFINSFGKLR